MSKKQIKSTPLVVHLGSALIGPPMDTFKRRALEFGLPPIKRRRCTVEDAVSYVNRLMALANSDVAPYTQSPHPLVLFRTQGREKMLINLVTPDDALLPLIVNLIVVQSGLSVLYRESEIVLLDRRSEPNSPVQRRKTLYEQHE